MYSWADRGDAVGMDSPVRHMHATTKGVEMTEVSYVAAVVGTCQDPKGTFGVTNGLRTGSTMCSRDRMWTAAVGIAAGVDAEIVGGGPLCEFRACMVSCDNNWGDSEDKV